MRNLKANPGKKIAIKVGNRKFARYPIKTKKVTQNDSIKQIVKNYVLPFIQKKDIVVISERVVAITQGRMIPIDKINPSFWAKFLYKFVTKNPAGIGLADPHTMELAIAEVGLFRIFIAAFISAITKPFGIKGIFYLIAGGNINAIDGPTSYSLPPGNKSATLGPEKPTLVAQKLKEIYDVGCAIIDANDYGVRVLGYSKGVDDKLLEKIFKDNPLGQAREQTPIAIVRELQR